MYGTVARIKVKPGAVEALKQMAEGEVPHVPGFVAQYVYQMDTDPSELYMVVVFESQEAYAANAESPEQHARYEQMMEWLEAEPEWHDGQIIYAEGVGD
jgi:quinol monooxygenase YgiN